MISRIIGFTPKLITNNQTNNQNINNFKYINFHSKYNLEKDTVSFSGNHKASVAAQFSPRVQSALSVQSKFNKLYRANNLSFETMQEVLNSKSPVPVTVKPMSEMPNLINAKNCQAYMQPVYEKDINLSGTVIYLTPDFSNKREAANIIADCVHEYTHILQRYEDADYLGIKDYTSNLEEARFLGFISGSAMKDLEKTLQNTVYSNKEFLEIYEKKLKTLTPITREDMIPFLPKKEELTDTIDNLLNVHFENTMDMFNVPKQYRGEYLYFYMRSKPTLEKSVIRQFQMESEAKQADIEARKSGVYSDFGSIFYHRINKSLYDSVIEILK